MKVRLIIMLTIFVLAAGGIMGYMRYLDSQIPKGDPDLHNQSTDEDGEFAVPDIEGGGAVAPKA